MTDFPGDMGWIAELIPDLDEKKKPFMVGSVEADEELVEVFFEELERLNSELKEGLSQNNSQLVREAAHSIKGMGGTLGVPEISALGYAVEMAGKEERLTDARPLVDALTDWLERSV